MVDMPWTIRAEVDEAPARRFRKRAMKKHGYEKGAMEKARELAGASVPLAVGAPTTFESYVGSAFAPPISAAPPPSAPRRRGFQ